MDKTIPSGPRRGRVTAPPSKSDAHRALICAALCGANPVGDGTPTLPTVLKLGALNADIEATVRCLEALGVGVTRGDGTLTITPQSAGPQPIRPVSPLLDCGESGATLRLMLPVATLLADNPRFIGAGRLPERPNAPLLDAMAANGCFSDSSTLPLTLSGTLRSGIYMLPGDVSSQYVSGLLLALSAVPGESEIRLTSPLESAAYVDMTIRTLSRFGVSVQRTVNNEQLTTGYQLVGTRRAGGGAPYSGQLSSPGTYIVEGDWSGAACFVALNALGGDVTVDGLDMESAQPDRAILHLAEELPETLDISAFPDLFPVLSVLACEKIGTTTFTGGRRLRIKESDRIAATARLIAALGGRCEERPDALAVFGTGRLRGGIADSENDHRIAMAAAVAAAICQEPVTVRGAEAVNKSYPGFWDDLEGLEIV
ncbi:MAG: 3-phosphoshikimate 1-carboxyvinyltransferase [Firmicutes bacterium]|nr:3-phosphoshikimate 1-carboxyvinyltransferase [Bacillota bacterium]